LYLVQKIVILFAVAQLCRKQRQGQTIGLVSSVGEYGWKQNSKVLKKQTQQSSCTYLVQQSTMPRWTIVLVSSVGEYVREKIL
jgi:hypothetical protein